MDWHVPVEAGRLLSLKLGCSFHDEQLLTQALIHSTYAYEHRQEGVVSNERLEFLGDAILDLVISEYLYQRPELLGEGAMTRTRSLVVCESTLAQLAGRLGIGSLLLLGKGEEQTGGREKPSNLANTMEAIFGALFQDSGYLAVRQFILELFQESIRQALSGLIVFDYKSRLLEMAQARKNSIIRFSILDEQGPVHERIFTAGVYLNDCFLSQGIGGSKKEAEQKAAQAALALIENDASILTS